MFNLFGFLKRKKKGCDRRKKSCRRPTRYNVAGSPCNRLKMRTCKSNRGCNYVRRRGCRRARNWRNIIAQPAVQNQIAQVAAQAAANAAENGAPIAQQAIMAGAAAADVAAANVLANGGTQANAQAAAIEAAQPVVADIIQQAGGNAQDVAQAEQQVQQLLLEAPPQEPVLGPEDFAELPNQAPTREINDNIRADASNRGTTAANEAAANAQAAGNNANQILLAARNSGVAAIKNYLQEQGIVSTQITPFLVEWKRDFQVQAAAFGRRRNFRFGNNFRRSRFGSVCSTLFPSNTSTCLNYNVNGMYPCNWSGGRNNRCQMRPGGSIPYSATGMGKYQSFVIAVVPGLAGVAAAPIPPPVGGLNGIDEEDVVAPVNAADIRGIYECIGRNQATCGGNPNCNWQSGANSGRGRCVRQVGHLGGEQYQGPMLPSAFGKRLRRYNVSGSPCNKLRKRVCRSSPNCSYTKRGCRRRSGTKSGAMVYEGPSLAFGSNTGCKSGDVKCIRDFYNQLNKSKAKPTSGNVRKLINSYEKMNKIGKRRKVKSSRRKSVRKPPAALLKRCRKYRIKTTIKRGKHRVYKSATVLKKLIKMKKMKKKSKVCRRRRMGFGRGPSVPFPMCHDKNRKPLPSVSKSTCISQGNYWW